jgi:glucosamine--fructose-6-phosphate aminotransferase (isomerizing)
MLAQDLNRLKPRGYDSAGMAVLDALGQIHTRKFANGEDGVAANGSLDALVAVSVDMPAASRGIAHTRWATHGAVATKNCHPHVSNDNSVYVVHNGILSNYASMKMHLEALGSVFTRPVPN